MTAVSRRSGVIHKTHAGEVIVCIQQLSACSGCHARQACTSADCADRYIAIPTTDTNYRVGDRVIVQGEDRIGRLAVFLSFVIPIALTIASVATSTKVLGVDESISVLIALAILGLYFLLLKLLDPQLGRIIHFSLERDISSEVEEPSLSEERPS